MNDTTKHYILLLVLLVTALSQALVFQQYFMLAPLYEGTRRFVTRRLPVGRWLRLALAKTR